MELALCIVVLTCTHILHIALVTGVIYQLSVFDCPRVDPVGISDVFDDHNACVIGFISWLILIVQGSISGSFMFLPSICIRIHIHIIYSYIYMFLCHAFGAWQPKQACFWLSWISFQGHFLNHQYLRARKQVTSQKAMQYMITILLLQDVGHPLSALLFGR